jgi:pyridinium-3,5-biscarboxylic acid mononucleotide synthase
VVIMDIKKLLKDVKSGDVNIEKAMEVLKDLPFEDIEFAKIDHHRKLRTGFPEVIYCPGKTNDQIKEIMKSMVDKGSNVLASRADAAVYDFLKPYFKKLKYHDRARLMTLKVHNIETRGMVSVVSAGTADIPVAEEAAITAEMTESKVRRIYDVGVAGIHRLLATRKELSSSNAVVVVAGMEGALGSIIGGLVRCPVIAVPTSVGYGASFKGIAALLSMLNSCAPNVSVVNIDNGFGAGYSASLINRQTVQGR